MFNLIILSLFTIATINAEPVWETLALSDCNGGISFLPSSPVSFKIRFHATKHTTKLSQSCPKVGIQKISKQCPFPTICIQKVHLPLIEIQHHDYTTPNRKNLLPFLFFFHFSCTTFLRFF